MQRPPETQYRLISVAKYVYATTSISPTNALHKIAKCIECSPDIFKICILLSVNTYILQNSMKLCTLKGLSNR